MVLLRPAVLLGTLNENALGRALGRDHPCRGDVGAAVMASVSVSGHLDGGDVESASEIENANEAWIVGVALLTAHPIAKTNV